MKLERINNSIRGSVWGLINRLVSTVFPFITRTVLMHTLGLQYLGLNGLFSSILNVLNITELGLSNAIVYNLYEPIAKDNYDEICSLVFLYRKFYKFVGLIILFAGLLLIPFLEKLIYAGYPKEINIYYLYILFLSNTFIGYFFYGYCEAILAAYQRNDIINKVRIVSFLCLYICQLLSLFLFKNIYFYIGFMILFTFIRGFWNYLFTKKLFPYINPQGFVSNAKKIIIKRIMIGTAIGKICTVTRGSCDDIVISATVGLTSLAMFDNYYYIIYAVISFLFVVIQSTIGGVGNSVATENLEKNYNDFFRLNFLYMWIVSWASVCLLCLIQPFMKLWVGKDLIFPTVTMVLFVIYFFSHSLSSIVSVYSNAGGLQWKSKYKSIFEVIVNLILNVLLGKIYGVNGILIATIITLIFINFLWGSKILFDNYFTEFDLKDIVKEQVFFAFITSIVSFFTYCIALRIEISNDVISLVCKLIICTVIPNLFFIILLLLNKKYKNYGIFILSIIKNFKLKKYKEN